MASLGVADIDDPDRDLDPGLGTGGEVPAVDVFDLEDGVERFGGPVSAAARPQARDSGRDRSNGSY